MLKTSQANDLQEFVYQSELGIVYKSPGKTYRHTADNAGQEKYGLKEMTSFNLLK